MAEISALNNITSQATQNSGTSPKELKDQFLTLLVTQLKNQDPTKPVENQEFISQLAQLTSLEQQQQLTDSNSAMLLQSSLSTGAALIGKTVRGQVTLGASTIDVDGEVKSIAVERGEVIYKVQGADGSIQDMRADQILAVTAGL